MVLPDGILRDCLVVKPRHCLALAIILPHPFLVRLVLHFPLLGWLFTGGCCETSLRSRILRRTFARYIALFYPRNKVSCVALQVRIRRSDSLVEMKKKNYVRSKVENGRTKLIVPGQIVHTLFISNFRLWLIAYTS